MLASGRQDLLIQQAKKGKGKQQEADADSMGEFCGRLEA